VKVFVNRVLKISVFGWVCRLWRCWDGWSGER